MGGGAHNFSHSLGTCHSPLTPPPPPPETGGNVILEELDRHLKLETSGTSEKLIIELGVRGNCVKMWVEFHILLHHVRYQNYDPGLEKLNLY
jgi:hypothetical protein